MVFKVLFTSFEIFLNVFAFLYVNFSTHRPCKKIGSLRNWGGDAEDNAD